MAAGSNCLKATFSKMGNYVLVIFTNVIQKPFKASKMASARV
jgi:hypothetical protein